ncbi:hypothetical protein WJX84_012022 [Apatococcus fuscideae]|uniref:Uncharacterized protein n=1 Tax=Apatococcus fuscideae TaxID=2026836 RepID=A0AAW1S283_9CHLO
MGRACIVTGSRSGIGLEIALQLLRLGDTVVLCSRSISSLPDQSEEVQGFVDAKKAFLVSADLGTEQGCLELMRSGLRLLENELDVLVNNAGLFFTVNTEETSTELWQKTQALNLDAAFHLTKAAAPHLAKTKGSIINISSVASYRPESGALAYCVSKAGLDMLTRGTAQDLASKGVRVNAINPGEVQTPIFKSSGMSDQEVEKYMAKWASLNPLGRVGVPADIANLAIFLADSSKAGWITGQCIVVDGGQRSFASQ